MSEDPLFRVTRGVPTPEELAALVGVLTVRLRPSGPPAPPPVSRWALSARPTAVAVLPGPGEWRASAFKLR